MLVHSGLTIASNQVCFSLIDRRPLQGLTSFCAEHGISILGFGAVAGGFLSNRWLDAPEPDWQAARHLVPDEVRALHPRGRRMGRVPARPARGERCGAEARRHDCHGRLALRARSARRRRRHHRRPARRTGVIEETLAIFSFSLDAADRQHLDEATAGLTPIPGDSGDEYRRQPYLTAAGDLSHHLDSFPPPYTVTPVNARRTMALSGTIWEDQAGYSRAVRVGSRIFVSGTTATHRNRVIGGTDSESQAHFVIDKIEGALQSLGGRLEDVVRTRIFVNRLADWQGVARAHGRRFGTIKPANTLVEAALVGDQYLVEIEADAELVELARRRRARGRLRTAPPDAHHGRHAAVPSRPLRSPGMGRRGALARHPSAPSCAGGRGDRRAPAPHPPGAARLPLRSCVRSRSPPRPPRTSPR